MQREAFSRDPYHHPDMYVIESLEQLYPDYFFESTYDPDRMVLKFAVCRNDGITEKLKEFRYDYWEIDCHDILREIRGYMDSLNTISAPTECQLISVSGTFEPAEPAVVKPRKCECCGAPLPRGTERCEYCGTYYY